MNNTSDINYKILSDTEEKEASGDIVPQRWTNRFYGVALFLASAGLLTAGGYVVYDANHAAGNEQGAGSEILGIFFLMMGSISALSSLYFACNIAKNPNFLFYFGGETQEQTVMLNSRSSDPGSLLL